MQNYEEKKFNIGELGGISAKQVEEHLKLYAGYVKNVNALIEKMEELKQGDGGPALAELQRRFGFEFNGMRLHEYYFEQFVKSESGGEKLKNALAQQYGSYDAWVEDFKSVGKLRGVGWALLVQDEPTGNLHNIWVSDHEVGHLGGQKILFAMDVWEHAFLLDYLPSGRGDYVEAFFGNMDWGVIEGRFSGK